MLTHWGLGGSNSAIPKKRLIFNPFWEMCYEPLEFCLIKVSFKSVCTSTSEKAMAPHSSTFAWKIPWTEEPGRLQSMGSLESDTTERPHFHFSLSCIGEGNGNPLQCSCLENPRDGEAWWAAVYGVAQSRTRLKQPSSRQQQQQYFYIWGLWLCHRVCGNNTINGECLFLFTCGLSSALSSLCREGREREKWTLNS